MFVFWYMSFLIENFDSDIHGIIESYTEYILTLNDSAGNVKNQSRSFFSLHRVSSNIPESSIRSPEWYYQHHAVSMTASSVAWRLNLRSTRTHPHVFTSHAYAVWSGVLLWYFDHTASHEQQLRPMQFFISGHLPVEVLQELGQWTLPCLSPRRPLPWKWYQTLVLPCPLAWRPLPRKWYQPLVPSLALKQGMWLTKVPQVSECI